jgi:hypothetical protein
VERILAILPPAQAYDIVIEQIRRIAQTPVGLGVWSIGAGTQAMFAALIGVALIKPIAGFSGWSWNP